MEQNWIDLALFSFLLTSFLISISALGIARYIRWDQDREDKYLMPEKELKEEVKKGERKMFIYKERRNLCSKILTKIYEHYYDSKDEIKLEIITRLESVEFISFMADMNVYIQKLFYDSTFNNFVPMDKKDNGKIDNKKHYHYFIECSILKKYNSDECEVF